MDDITLQHAVYKGSKKMNLSHIPVAKATGFSAAADDYMERGIDLNEQLITNKPATFFFRMNSDAMIGTGIKSGDILIVDRSLKAANGKIIVAAFEGELVVRRLQTTAGAVTLVSGNKNYASAVITQWSLYAVWGVVTYVIHTV